MLPHARGLGVCLVPVHINESFYHSKTLLVEALRQHSRSQTIPVMSMNCLIDSESEVVEDLGSNHPRRPHERRLPLLSRYSRLTLPRSNFERLHSTLPSLSITTTHDAYERSANEICMVRERAMTFIQQGGRLVS